MVTASIEQDNEVFKSRQFRNIALISFQALSIELLGKYEARQKLLTLFDDLLLNLSVKVVVLYTPCSLLNKADFWGLFNCWSESKMSSYEPLRLGAIFDQIMVKIIESDKLFISAQSGKVMFPFFGISLACDYRVIADNFILQNHEVKAGWIPKGAAVLLMSRLLRPSRIIDVLLSGTEINAYEMLREQLVDKVVPFNKLRFTALEIADKFARKPSTSLSGVKKMVNYSLKDFRGYLAYENEQFYRILNILRPK